MKVFGVLLLFVLLLLGGGGCAEPGAGPGPTAVSLDSWQRSIERFVRDEGNGDPNILRDTTLPTSQRGFAVIGEPMVERSTDADGLLLGHRMVANRGWFIFLVGLIQDGALQDIRLAAFSCSAGNFSWRISAPNPQSLEQYAARHGSSGGRYAIFPAREDRFDWAIEGEKVTATETQSKAGWELRLPPPDRSTLGAAAQ